MASSTLVGSGSYTLMETPFVWRVLKVTTGTDATAIAHGGQGVPDAYWAVVAQANPTASEVSVYSPTATTITVDCEGASKTVFIHCIWSNIGVEDGTSITVS